MDESLRAIADPTRRSILLLTLERELPAGEIAEHFDVTRPAISQHLRVLKDTGLVTERREGTFRFYRASPAGLAELRTSLDWLLDDGLARLKALAETEERTGSAGGEDVEDDGAGAPRRGAGRP
jgi:DNA-binding transcriptional ArsR family regulator